MRIFLLGLAHALLVSAACGGGGGGGGPPDAIAQGAITGTGSLAVTGTLFEIDDDTEIELEPGTPGLAVGMQVTVEGERSGDSGTANRVTFDDDLLGPVESVDDVVVADEVKELGILGQTVVLEEPVTLFDGTSFDAIAVDDVVEVSGLRDGDGVIHATWVRHVTAPNHVSLEGEVTGPITGSFMIGPIEIQYDGTTELVGVPETGLAAGDFVDVRGVLQDADTVDARGLAPNNVIELEARAIDGNRRDVQREGIVAELASLADFELDGQPVDAGLFGVDFEPSGLPIDLEEGSRIEVEGNLEDGVLVADAVKLRAGEVRIEGALGDPAPVDLALGTVELLDTATLEVDVATRFDGAGFDDLTDLASGDLLEVRGIDLGDAVRPTEIRRVDDLAGVRVRGRVESFDGSDGTFTIVGVEIEADPGTSYQGFPAVGNAAQFFAFLSACPTALLDVTAAADPVPSEFGVAGVIALDEGCTP
jgi:hypothetical protein